APQPIEARLKTSRWIAEAVLLGDARPFVVALLVPNFGALEAEAKTRGWPAERGALIAHPEGRALLQAEVDAVNADLAPFETSKNFALLGHEMTQETGELTPTLKVKRRVVVQKQGETNESPQRPARRGARPR